MKYLLVFVRSFVVVVVVDGETNINSFKINMNGKGCIALSNIRFRSFDRLFMDFSLVLSVEWRIKSHKKEVPNI